MQIVSQQTRQKIIDGGCSMKKVTEYVHIIQCNEARLSSTDQSIVCHIVWKTDPWKLEQEKWMTDSRQQTTKRFFLQLLNVKMFKKK